MERLFIEKLKNKIKKVSFRLEIRDFLNSEKLSRKFGIQLLLVLIPFVSFAQWNPNAPFYTAKEDCPVAMRICDATQEYNFELVSWGDIDDAHGMLYLAGLSQSSITRFESKVCWLKFVPQYSGQLGMDICRESQERLQYQMWTNPNCEDFHIVNYITPNTTSSTDIICTGYGFDSPNSTGGSSYLPYIDVVAGNTYVFLILTSVFNQAGTHRFTLKFTGQLIQDHPDVFDHPDCALSTEDFVKQETKVYPNPFTNSFHILSEEEFVTLALYDVTGKQIIQRDFVKELDASKLAKGMYLLKLTTASGLVVYKKVVKE